MTHSHIDEQLLLGTIDSARRIIGDDAIKIASSIEGLKVTQNGEITISGKCMQILNKLIKAYEDEIHGGIFLSLSVRMSVKYASNNEHK
jgi:hypothetical protein